MLAEILVLTLFFNAIKLAREISRVQAKRTKD